MRLASKEHKYFPILLYFGKFCSNSFLKQNRQNGKANGKKKDQKCYQLDSKELTESDSKELTELCRKSLEALFPNKLNGWSHSCFAFVLGVGHVNLKCLGHNGHPAHIHFNSILDM